MFERLLTGEQKERKKRKKEKIREKIRDTNCVKDLPLQPTKYEGVFTFRINANRVNFRLLYMRETETLSVKRKN